MSFSLCHYVLKKTPVTFVLMLLCLQNDPPVTFVFMLLCLKNHLICYSCLTLLPCLPHPVSPVLMLLCLKNHPICYSCLTLLPCLPYPVSPVLGYSVFQAEARGEESGRSFPAHGEL